jgi:PAS domain S-box-containing protein
MVTRRAVRCGHHDDSRLIAKCASEESIERQQVAEGGFWPRAGRGSARQWFSMFILLCVLSGLPAAAEPAAKNVLILHNWTTLPQSWTMMESTVRARVPAQINFYAASVENPRFDEKDYQENLAETLRGYGKVKLDVVVAATYPVFQFAMQYRDKMFPGVPIVFTDISAQQEQDILPGATGVISRLGLPETIDLALRLHPDTTSVAVITGVSAWDKYWFSVAHSELLLRQDKVREIDLIEPEPEGSKILAKVAQLPPHTVVLFQLRPSDFVQSAVEPIDVLATVAQRLPTYSAWQGLALTHGGVGGAYRDLPKEAVLNGEVVARILSGERPENIPYVHDPELRVNVDWRALQRWHIPESALPPGSVILYRDPTLWERDGTYVIAASAVIAVLCSLILALVWQRARKRKAEAVLRESEKRFRVMADTTPSLIWMCDSKGNITYQNDRRVTFTGHDSRPSSGYVDVCKAYVHPDDLDKVRNTFSRALEHHESFAKEYRLRRYDGVYRWMFDVASPRVNGDGSFAGFIGSAIDITDQKLAQEALEKISGRLIEAQEEERSRIARELHDDICQRLALLSIELEQVNRRPTDSAAISDQRLRDVREHCLGIASDVQSLSHKLHSSKLEYLGVVAAIRGFCKEFAKQHEVSIEFTDWNVPKNLPRDISLCLFRVAQEALNNAVKYSGVVQFTVELRGLPTEVQLEVRDAGAGFEMEDVKSSRGLGLVSMEERVHLVNGRFSIESKPGAGTRIVATVPVISAIAVSSVGAASNQTTSVTEAA